jgi:hypothetical protein
MIDIQQEVYDRLQECVKASTLISTIYEGVKHEYTGTIDELRRQVKLGVLKWVNEL